MTYPWLTIIFIVVILVCFAYIAYTIWFSNNKVAIWFTILFMIIIIAVVVLAFVLPKYVVL